MCLVHKVPPCHLQTVTLNRTVLYPTYIPTHASTPESYLVDVHSDWEITSDPLTHTAAETPQMGNLSHRPSQPMS